VLDDPVHDADVFGETSAGRLEPGGATDFLVSRALGKSFVLAVKTLAARDVVEDHDPVARAVRLDAFANRYYYAGGFVSEDAGGGMGAGGNLLEVCTADAAGVHADEHFAGTDLGDGHSFDADVVHAAIDSRLHGGGDRMQLSFDRKLSGKSHYFILDDAGG
jgi:hypothetical protein